MGYGSKTTGGLNGDTLYVTNLNDNGPGSFRDLIDKDTSRVIEFLIAGEIKLKSPIKVSNGNLTVNGPTSFSEGISFINYGIHFIENCSNVILRNISIRVKNKDISAAGDGIAFHPRGGKIKNILIDHCSIFFAGDENFDTWGDVSNLTCQWTIIAESERGFILGGSKKNHPSKITIHHCLFANNIDRNPSFGFGGPYEFINNVIYNWFNNNATKVRQGSVVDIVNNYYIPGPDSSPEDGIIFPIHPELKTSIYASGNYLANSANINQWDNITYYYTKNDSLVKVKPAPSSFRRLNRTEERSNIVIYDRDKLFEIVMNNVGPKIRDQYDNNLIKNIMKNS